MTDSELRQAKDRAKTLERVAENLKQEMLTLDVLSQHMLSDLRQADVPARLAAAIANDAAAPIELCPTCKQPMPRDAITANPHAERGAQALKCEFCDRDASFIIQKQAVCFEHRKSVSNH